MSFPPSATRMVTFRSSRASASVASNEISAGAPKRTLLTRLGQREGARFGSIVIFCVIGVARGADARIVTLRAELPLAFNSVRKVWPVAELGAAPSRFQLSPRVLRAGRGGGPTGHS